eukprot:6214141-Pleurochrysis_carterae.AAC.7
MHTVAMHTPSSVPTMGTMHRQTVQSSTPTAASPDASTVVAEKLYGPWSTRAVNSAKKEVIQTNTAVLCGSAAAAAAASRSSSTITSAETHMAPDAITEPRYDGPCYYTTTRCCSAGRRLVPV